MPQFLAGGGSGNGVGLEVEEYFLERFVSEF